MLAVDMSKVGGREAVTVDEAAVLREHSRRREPVVQQHMDLLPRERSLHHVGSSAQPLMDIREIGYVTL